MALVARFCVLSLCLLGVACDGVSPRAHSSGEHDSDSNAGAAAAGSPADKPSNAEENHAADASDSDDVIPPMCNAQARTSRAPGPALAELTTKGGGPCAGVSLGATIDGVHAAHPELADIQSLYTPEENHRGDRNFIYAFATKDGGFALVFRRGGGDCFAGCTENEYWYFRTDSSCEPQSVGHYLPEFTPSGCTATEGFPLWDHPVPLDPGALCGNVVVDALSPLGEYTKHACGQRLACVTKAEKPEAVDLELSFRIEAQGNAVKLQLQNTGVPNLDGRWLTATLQSQRLSVVERLDNLPSACPEQHELDVLIDFSGLQPSFVRYFESMTPDCATPDVYCKGLLQLDLGYIPSDSCTAATDLSAAIATLRARPRPCETDSDCTLLTVGASCGGSCPLAVRADAADELGKLFNQVAAAICQDSDCFGHRPWCPAQRAVCKEKTCAAVVPFAP